MWKFDQKPNFQHQLAWIWPYKSRREQTREKHDIQVPGVVLHSFYVLIVSINFIYSLNLKVWPKIKLLAPIDLS